jgi:hypothetical protein
MKSNDTFFDLSRREMLSAFTALPALPLLLPTSALAQMQETLPPSPAAQARVTDPLPSWNDTIVHIVDLYTTLARVGGAEVPKDRPIDGVDQLDFFLGKQEASNREGFPAYVADRLSAVKWRNWKAHFIWQENMYAPPQKLPLPKIINLLTDRKEERDVAASSSWVIDPIVKIVGDFEASLKKYPPIKLGTPDPYTPPASQ